MSKIIGKMVDNSKVFKVDFDSDGGSAVGFQIVVAGEKAVEPTDPTKQDKTFGGWFIGEEEYDFDDVVTEHLTLKAKWN